MRRELSVLLIGATILAGMVVTSVAWQRKSDNLNSSSVTLDNGQAAKGLEVFVGTTTPVQVYTPGTPLNGAFDSPDRFITLQSTSGFKLWCSTSSTGFSFKSGPRWIIWPSTVVASQGFYTDNTSGIWCVFEPSAGAGFQSVYGRIEYDSRD